MRGTLLYLLLSLFATGLASAETVRLTNGEWPPYLGEQLPHNGVVSRIITEAFALQGITVEWEFYPWARALQMAQRGTRNGTAAWLFSREREVIFFISDSLIESGHHLFHRKNYSFDWQQFSDLHGHRSAGTRGYEYGEAFQQAEAQGQLRVNRVTSDETGFRQLLAGRVDLFPIDKVVGFDMLYQNFTAAERAQLCFHPKPLRSEHLHLLMSRAVPGNAELMARFNKGLAQLRESGKISQYLLDIQQPLSLSP